MLALIFGLVAFQTSSGSPDVGPLVRSFWLLQSFGTADATDPANDLRVKGVLAKALAKDNEITLPELGGLMKPDVFQKLAGTDSKIDATEVAGVVADTVPESRKNLKPKARNHADFLTTTFDMIDEPHREAGQKLAE